MKHFLTEADVRDLQEHLRENHLEALITLALMTGMRRDELLHLTWSEVDLENHEIRVVNSKPKNCVRVISISEKVAQALRDHQVDQMSHRSDAHIRSPGFDLVFSDDAGGVLSLQRFVEMWNTSLEQARLPHLCFHKLRIFVWRRLLEQGREASKRCNAGQDGSLDCENRADG
jgi:integrase